MRSRLSSDSVRVIRQKIWHLKKWILLGLFLISMLGAVGLQQWYFNEEGIEIAINLPVNPNGRSDIAANAREMWRGSQIYINEVNRQGGVNGHRLKLTKVVMQGADHEKYAVEQAKKTANSEAIAMIGGYYSSLMIAAGKVYEDAEMPAITGIALADEVTKDNNYFFRVVPNRSWRSSFIASYIYQVLGHRNVGIVLDPEDIEFGLGSAQDFKASFQEQGGTVTNEWLINEQSPEAIATELVALNPDIAFLALQSDQITSVVKAARREGFENPMFVAVSSWSAQSLANELEERENPGALSHDVYMTADLIYDVASKVALDFRRQYATQYDNEEFRPVTAISYDVTKAMVAAIEKSNVTGHANAIKEERQKVQQAIAKLNRPRNAIDGLSGQIYFNNDGDAEKPPAVGIFQKRRLISAYEQLKINPAFIPSVKEAIKEKEEGKNITQLAKILNKEKLLLVNNLPMKVANVIYTGIDINKVLEIDQKESKYKIDFFIWFKYHKRENLEPRLVEFINSSESSLAIENPVQVTVNGEIMTEDYEAEEGDLITEAYRVKEIFQEPFEFYDYPFDTQNLAIRLRHQSLDRSEILYVVDLLGMRDTDLSQTIKNWETHNVFDTITDWQLKKVSFYPDVLSNLSTLGFSDENRSGDRLEYSRFNAVIEVERNRKAFLLKNLLPLIFFLFVGYINFFIPLSQTKFAAVTSLLMAVVFFHLNLLNKLPERVGYIVALDYAFYSIYAMLGFQILLFVIGYYKPIRANPQYLQRLTMAGQIGYPVTLVIAFVTFLIIYV
ncbi:amino acid/amide ABC transporter substrate-binding protein, HAAT family [[Leptolyngbya] sp. PCC 7376]|uniref:ABC transporter substrate-binding protein n=1 Tax=[Leptolyngbya] sp. PCC 7376 TaxID=111781 RepID=UPI00029EC3C0|nr:ABC transporter substrate-binding protein [[Leptolyngbya] sp. PCC 7376]AFY37556.1 amino acid/amide ABC transporter substrate-binding protein, HAAT family [[Leptolyngbya] sp. PCC 7376]